MLEMTKMDVTRQWISAASAAILHRLGRLNLMERLALMCGTVLAAFGLVLIIGLFQLERAQIEGEQSARLESELTILEQALASFAQLGDRQGAMQFLTVFAEQAGVERVVWRDASGQERRFEGKSTANTAPGWLVAWAGLPQARDEREIMTDLVVNGSDLGRVSLSLSHNDLLYRLWTLMIGVTLLILFGAPVLLTVTLLTVTYGLRPAAGLAQAMKRFGDGHFDARLNPVGTPRVAAGIRAFNAMAERVCATLETLHESEARFRHLAMIVEQSSESILTRDLNGIITSWNRGAERLLGWTAQEAIGRSGRELHLRDVSDEEYERMLQRMHSSECWASEGQRLSKSGAVLQVMATRAPLLDADGRVIGEIGIARDVTDLKRAQAELLRANSELEARVRERTVELGRNEALLRAIMDAMPGVVVYMDVDQRCQMVNGQIQDWLGVSAAEMLGQIPWALAGVEAERVVAPYMAQALAGQSVRFEWQFHTPNGHDREVDTTLVPVRTGNGESAGVASFSMDISERKRAEATLAASRARNRVLAAMVEQSSDAIHARDMDGCITYWNPGAERLCGFSAQEAIGQPLKALHLREHSSESLAAILARIRAGQSAQFDGYALTKSGQTLDVMVRTSPLLDGQGQPVGEVSELRDISAAKHAERELYRAKDAAEAANRAKSEFLANMSHEIRTPLNGVIGLTELVLDSELTREQRQDLELVQSSGRSLLTIINDVLDFSKIEAGHLELESIEFAPADAIADMLKVLATHARTKGVTLVYDPQALPPLLLGDPGRLRQVVNNLVGNAVKFTGHGDVVVTASASECATSGEVTLHLSVRDSGVGIPKDKQVAIFEAFTQADASTTRCYGGTGLGLAISAKLVGLMGGTIRVESAPGEGSTFSFGVRCAKVVSPAKLPVGEPHSQVGQAVLVVEDNDHYRQALLRMLTGWGLLPTAATSGEQALTLLAEAHAVGQPFSLLLLDVQLPGMDGFAVAERVMQSPQWACVVLMLTGIGQRGDAVRCRELGVAAFLTKPIKPSELLDALVAASNRSSVCTESTRPLITRHSRREACPGHSILVAEDNETNELLARRVLQKLGHRVHVVNNGQEAVDAVATEAFDLVLMDMQMPVMSGIDATVAIRALEVGATTRVPIVALTANAMSGDREICLAAGMDDYMTKPFNAGQIELMLRRWLSAEAEATPQRAGATLAVGHGAPLGHEGSLDVEVLKGYIGDDDDDVAVEEFLRSYLALSSKLADEMRASWDERRADVLSARAHSLKSMVRTVGALALGHLCESLETAGKVEDWPTIETAMTRFDDLLAGVAADADHWLAGHANTSTNTSSRNS